MSLLRERALALLWRVGALACLAVSRGSPRRLLGIAIVIGALLRAGFLFLWPITPHEVHYLREARQVLDAGSVRVMGGSVHGWGPALAYARVLAAFPSANERDLRWIQLGCSLVTLLGVAALGWRAVSPRAGAAAALVFALTPQAIYYGASSEPYSSHLVFTLALLALYGAAWRSGRVLPVLAIAVVGAVATFHHLLAALVLGILGLHALTAPGAPRVSRVIVPLAAALAIAAALPMWAHGDPGYGARILYATIPYYFSVDILGWLVAFLVLWDATAERFDSAWPGVLALLFVIPVIVFLPHMKLLYVLTGAIPMSLVLGAALAEGRAPRWIGAIVLYEVIYVASSVPT